MKICKIWDAEYPWDVRVEKIARELTAAGHEVHLVARNRDGRAVREELPECTIHRLAPLRLRSSRLNAASMFPAFFNPRWIRKITSVARMIGADALLVRDLPLTPTAIWVGKRLGIPVVLDMAENYPAMIRSMWENDCYHFPDRLVRNPAMVERVEKWCIQRVDHIIVVVEESRNRLIDLGVPPERVTIVGNTPSGVARDHSPHELASRTSESADSPLDVTYLGLLEEPRGIATLMRAVAICRAASHPVRLSLLGDGRERSRFESLARELGLDEDAIRFRGFVPRAQALDALNEADVGAIPHHADESWNTTIPNKLFDYMAAGVSVLASDAVPVARVIHETGCGEVFRSEDPEDAARAIVRLRDTAHRTRCAAAGRAAIREKYHWESDATRLRAVFSTADRPRRER